MVWPRLVPGLGTTACAGPRYGRKLPFYQFGQSALTRSGKTAIFYRNSPVWLRCSGGLDVKS